MQTRIERFKNYRDQIYNDGVLLNKIENDSNTITEYKKQINSISPSILKEIEQDNQIARVISIDNINKNDNEFINNILEFIHEKKINQAREEIKKIRNSQNYKMIVDNSGRVNEEWLKSSIGYNELKNYKTKINDASEAISNFEMNSITRNGNVEKLINSGAKDKIIIENSVTKFSDNNTKRKSFALFLFPSILSLVSLVLIIISIVVLLAVEN